MLKKLHVLLLVLLAAVCFTATAWADYDYIEQYGVMVTPNTEDGSLLITVLVLVLAEGLFLYYSYNDRS